jgi:hypothetical protein
LQAQRWPEQAVKRALQTVFTRRLTGWVGSWKSKRIGGGEDSIVGTPTAGMVLAGIGADMLGVAAAAGAVAGVGKAGAVAGVDIIIMGIITAGAIMVTTTVVEATLVREAPQEEQHHPTCG